MSKNLEIKLSTGVVISLREPKVRDMRLVAGEKNEQEMEIKLIANLTGLTEKEIDDMTLKDYGLIAKEVNSFLF